MGSIILPVREKDTIVTFNIIPYTIRNDDKKSGYSTGDIECRSSGKTTRIYNLSSRTESEFFKILSGDDACLTDKLSYHVHNKGVIYNFSYPDYCSKKSLELVKIYDEFLKSICKEEDFAINLGNIPYDREKAYNYIELGDSLKKLTEEKRIRILKNTQHYCDILDIATFLKDIPVRGNTQLPIKSYYEAARIFDMLPNIGPICNKKEYIDIAENNGKHLEVLNQVLALTYPDQTGKFLLKTYSDKKRMN